MKNNLFYKKLILSLNYYENNLFQYFKKVSKTFFNFGYSLDTKNNLFDNTGICLLNDISLDYEKIFNFRNNIKEDSIEYGISFKNAIDFYIEFKTKYPKILNELRKLNNSTMRKTTRLRYKIERMITKPCLFLTLTFSDKTLKNTNMKTRRKYISRFLESLDSYYIGNIDFGDNHIYTDLHGILRRATGREHYHAIIQTDFIDLKSYNLGWINVEHIYVKTDSEKKLAKYITKLTNHAIKESTKRQNLLYSKKYKIL